MLNFKYEKILSEYSEKKRSYWENIVQLEVVYSTEGSG